MNRNPFRNGNPYRIGIGFWAWAGLSEMRKTGVMEFYGTGNKMEVVIYHHFLHRFLVTKDEIEFALGGEVSPTPGFTGENYKW